MTINPGKVICQVCKNETDGTRLDGLTVAKDHLRANGEYCLGSHIFALPVEERAKIRSFAITSDRVGDTRLPAAETNIHQSVCGKFCSCLAMIFKSF